MSRDRRHHPSRHRPPAPFPQPPSQPPPGGPAESSPDGTPGTLYVVATPIGNLEDVTLRALRVLREAPVLACEDTRSTGLLLQRLEIPRNDRRMVPYHDVNERRQSQLLLQILQSGQDVALVSDAGTPLVSDPGYRVVALAREAGIPVVPVPGACAAVAALCASGLPTDRFTFLGFLPAKAGRRARLLQSLDGERGTCVFYVPARAVDAALADLQAAHPDWTVVVARELTKVFEEFATGTPATVRAALAGRALKGEVTLLAAPPVREGAEPPDPDGAEG
jgi:16S rRNA (cytidine1402-2'-O)-methyltransferase